ncbi:MAG: nuclear transport factor 2 family protein [Caulobacter sp.]|nr:nuclear transport factor 2 family protein [Caulobacter sp.]
MNLDDDFTAFLERRRAVAQAYVNGDAGPLGEIATQSNPASFFPPNGGRETGAGHVTAVNARGSRSFGEGGETTLEILHGQASGDLAYWTGLQHAVVRLNGHSDPVATHLRVTEVFRREDGEWKMIHRHADTLVEAAAR